jgi:hypothetical protein
MSGIADDQRELLRALTCHGVDFVVVGGVAAQIHGWTSATLDLDIAVSSEDTNVDRVNAALASVGASLHEQEVTDDLAVVVAAPDDILRSKEAAGRDKDLAALPRMRKDFENAGLL